MALLKPEGDGQASDGSPWRPLLLVVAVLIGAAGVGNHLAHDRANDATTTLAIPPAPSDRSGKSGDLPIRPDPISRPLALFYQALIGGRIFAADSDGRPRLVPPRDVTQPLLPGGNARRNDPPVAADPCKLFKGIAADGLPVVDTLTCQAVVRVRSMLAKSNSRAEVVIATLPDWIDSSLKWTFDDQLSALETSAAQLGYTFVTFDLPDTEAAPVNTSEAPLRFPLAKLHESTPGTLIFRKDGDGGTVWLQLLLVGETPTSGIHEEALVAAIHYAELWDLPEFAPGAGGHGCPQNGLDQRPPIRIVGPTYSGSARSLATVMRAEQLREGVCGGPYDIVTPSATSADNKALLSISGLSAFRSVVHSDAEELEGLTKFLTRTSPDWTCGQHTALLVESQTQWGLQFATSALEYPNSCEECLSGRPAKGDTTIYGLSCAAIVRFPLHISRLRDDAKAAATPAIQVPGSATVALHLEDRQTPVDRVPAMTPELTAATAEIMVNGMFREIEDRHATAIGIFATDKRDHLYLAEQIARRRPNVLSFTLESNLIFLHPDVASYVRGSIVASTYALDERVQRITHPNLAKISSQQFGSSAGHGEFNAFALIMGHPETMSAYGPPRAFEDAVYTQPTIGPCLPDPAKRDCVPPVWISVVGHGGLMPIAAMTPAEPTKDADRAGAPARDSYITGVRPSPDCLAAASARDPRCVTDIGPYYLKQARPALIVLALLVIGGIIHAAVWIRQRVSAVRNIERSNAFRDPAMNEGRAARLAAYGALYATGLWVTKLALIVQHDRSLTWCRWIEPAYSTIAVLGTAAYVIALARRCALDDNRPAARWVVRIAAVTFAALAACMSLHGTRPLWLVSAILVIPVIAIFADCRRRTLRSAERMRRIPIVLGMGALACFVTYLLFGIQDGPGALLDVDRHLSLTTLASPGVVIVLLFGAVYWWAVWNLRRVQLLLTPEIAVGIGPFLRERAESAGLRSDDVLRRPAMAVGNIIALPLAVVVIGLVWGYGNSSTIEGPAFSGFLYLGSLCVMTTFVHALAHTWTLGQSVRHLLDSLASHRASARYAELGKESFHWQLTFDPIRWRELGAFNARLEDVVDRLNEWPDDDLETLNLPAEFISRLVEDTVTAARNTADASNSDGFAKAVAGSHWKLLDGLMTQYVAFLTDTRWSRAEKRPVLSQRADTALAAVEYAVLFHAGLVLRDLMTRLVTGFTAALGGLLLLFAAHLFYTFQGRIFWLGFDAFAVGASALFAIRILLDLERDATLSRLWGTTPGQLSLFGGLTLRAGLYAFISGLTLFSVFFPEVAGDLAAWLVPIKSLVP